MLVADTLTADLTFYANGERDARSGPRDAGAARRQRGRRDALRARAPRAAAGRARGVLRPARGRRRRARRHARARGWRRCACAEAVLASAARGETRPRAVDVRAVVVALGKIGLPLAAQLARAGPRGRRLRRRPARGRRSSTPARAPFPGEAGLDEALAEVVAAGRLRAQTDTAAAVAEGPDLVDRGPAAGGRRARPARTGASSTRSSTTSAAGWPAAARTVV